MKVNKKKVIKEVAKINSVELCSIDMLVRVDEYNGKFFACDGCIYKDTGKFIFMCLTSWWITIEVWYARWV